MLRVGDILHFLTPTLCYAQRDGIPLSKAVSNKVGTRQTDLFVVDGGKTEAKEQGEPRPRKESKYPAGSRWITVHPNGSDEKGVPILIQPNKDGTATVIGGAGGKLNFLHLTKLRSEDDWKAAAKRRAEDKKLAEKDRRSGLTEEEKQAEDDAKLQEKKIKQKSIHENAAKTLDLLDKYGIQHGLDEAQKAALTTVPAQGSDPDVIRQWQETADNAAAQVKRIQEAYEHKLITDHEARAAAFAGDESLGDVGNAVIQNREHQVADPDGNEVAHLAQLPDGRWAVHTPDPDIPDQSFESWGAAAKHYVGTVVATEKGSPQQPDEFYSPNQWIKSHPEEELPEGFSFNPAAAKEIVKLAAERKAALNPNQPKTGVSRGGGIQLAGEQSDISDDELLAKLEQDAQTLEDAVRGNRLLDMVGSQAAGLLRQHMGAGGYNALAQASSEVLTDNVLNRGMVDLLGHEESAKVLAYSIGQSIPNAGERKMIAEAYGAYHAKMSRELGDRAIEQATPLIAQQKDIHARIIDLQQSGNLMDPEMQIEIDNLTYEAEQIGSRISKLLGNALGVLESSAALSAALQTKNKTLQFSGRGLNRFGSDPLKTLEAFGLGADDFELGMLADGSESLEIKESGLSKLARNVEPDRRRQYLQAQAIKRGELDEENWLPDGFAYRPAKTFGDPKLEAERFNVSLSIDEEMSASDMDQALKAYVGARVANGDDPLKVMNAIQSPGFYLNLGLDPYGDAATRAQKAAIDLVNSAAGGSSGFPSSSQIRQAFRDLGEKEASRQRLSRATDDMEALHSQTVDPDVGMEAAHRVLSADPMARVVFKDLSQMNARERRWVRDHAISEILGWETPEKPPAPEEDPGFEEVGLFGDAFGGGDAAVETQSESQWQQFSRFMGGDKRAYDAVIDHLRGQAMNRFASAYSAISGQSMMTGSAPKMHVERLEVAKLPEDQRAAMLEWMRSRDQSDIAKVRARSGGKFATEMDPEWMSKMDELKGASRQISLFADESVEDPNSAAQYTRTTIGEQAEAQVAQLMQSVIPAFEQIQKPIDLYPEENWGSGTQGVEKQRFIKLLERQKKMGMWFGPGSGKTSGLLGSFTHLQKQPDAPRKMIAAVPSNTLGQFVTEAAQFLDPGKFKAVAAINMSREQRLEAMRGDAQMYFTTREGLTNDVLSMVQDHFGVTSEQFAAGSDEQRQNWVGDALRREGIDPSSLMMAVDESHDVSTRRGAEASARSLVVDALAHHASHYVEATGTPQKNDLSEIYSFLRRVDPERAGSREQFLKQYGQNVPGSERALQRLLAPYTHVVDLPPVDKSTGRKIEANSSQPVIPLSEQQAQQRQEIKSAYEVVRGFYSEVVKGMGGRPPTPEDFAHAYEDPAVRAAVEKLGSPLTYGKKDEGGKKAAIGGMVMGAAGLRDTALFRAYHLAPYENNPKAQWTVEEAVKRHKDGIPGVVFAARTEAARDIVSQLQKRGVRVGFIHGGLNPEQKEQEKLRFNPAKGQPREVDVLVCTDAAQTGMNAQAGKWMIQYDIPYTAKAWEQRAKRIYRRGQDQDVEILTPMLDSPEERIAWARKERKGSQGSAFQMRSELLDDTGLAGEIERHRRGV